jgi:ribosomal protein S18 acetylase RimI-like enzyme
MIRKATSLDIDRILEVTLACAKYMDKKGIHQWNSCYPSKEQFEIDVERDKLYVLEKHKALIGCIVISTIMDDEYVPIQWLTPNAKNIYIHRLAVQPDYQGQAYAQTLMSFAEEFAQKNNYASVRLDTFSVNKRNQRFCELRGYKKLGDIYFPKQSEFPFHCYELIL